MGLRFSKMHGIGNDFVLIDARARPLAPDPHWVRAIADRHRGVGFDQLISVEAARDPDCAFYYGIWNADGSPAAQCGNGVRCVAAWLHRAGALPLGRAVRLQSPSGAVTVRLLDPHTVAVEMGEPQFAPAAIPFLAEPVQDRYRLVADGWSGEIGAVSMGNPHAVVVVEALDDPAWARLGPALTGHPLFPEGANAGFVRRVDRSRLQLRVHERGSGWTRACGTGACAAMAVLRRRGEVEPRVTVELPGGELVIEWSGPGEPLWMTGPARFAFEGEWH